MHRRALLAGMTLLAAGCTARGEPNAADDVDRVDGADGAEGVDGEPPAVSTPQDRSVGDVSPGIDVEIVERDPEMEAGTAVVTFESDAVHVDGTLVGATGCHAASVASATTAEDGTFRLVVAAVDDAAPDELCTLAFTEIGYAVDLEFVDDVPEEVAVVHADAMGHETVVVDADDDG